MPDPSREDHHPLRPYTPRFQEQMLDLLDMAGAIIVALDDAATITFVNKSGAEMLGWTQEDLTGRDWFDFCLPQDVREPVRKVYRAAVDGSDFARVYQNDVLHADGSVMPVLWYNTALRDEDGRLIITLSIGQDMREITSLRDTAERLQMIAESTSDMIGWVSADGKMQYLNRGGIAMLGYESEEEVVGKRMEEFHPTREHKRMRESIIPEAREKGRWQGELSLKRQDGTEVPASWTIVPQYKDGELESFSAIVRDVSEEVASRERIASLNQELTEVNAELEQALLTQQTFLANVSHELRTPLNSIIGFTGIMREGMAGPVTDEQQRQLDMVYASSTRLLRLINQVLDLSKIESDSVAVHPSEFDLAELLGRTAEISRPMVEQKMLELELQVGATEMPAYQDDLKIEQIVLNLISNAIRHTGSGKITLTAVTEGSGFKICVSDTGAGIPEDELDRVFEQFYQAPQARRGKTEGTGLGLSIARELSRLIGGSLEVKSTLDVGTTFTLSIPTHLNVS